jgi:rare lipoprotein A
MRPNLTNPALNRTSGLRLPDLGPTTGAMEVTYLPPFLKAPGHRWRQALLLAGLLPLLVACTTIALPGAGWFGKGDPVAVSPPPEPRPAPRPADVPPKAAPAANPPSPGVAVAPPDAVPRVERIPQREPNLPYVVRGDAYAPESRDVPMTEVGLASWYGAPFHGRRTANGEVYNMNAMTAAHKTMPLPSYALVRNRSNGKQIVVRVNDRGPFKYEGRVIDLSRAAARKLGISGLGKVEVRRLTHEEIRTGSWKQPSTRVAVAGASESPAR